MARAIILILDSVGIGAAPDAAAYGDAGADTVGHIARACASGAADGASRSGALHIPNLMRLGLGEAYRAAHGCSLAVTPAPRPEAMFGSAREVSKGKDTPSGHWEIAGCPVTFEWGYFPQSVPAFPTDLIDELIERTGVPGFIGLVHASGTDIIDRLGEDHMRTGRPIAYTSADSVFQIAAHEETFGLDRLQVVCKQAFDVVSPLRIGRVIARPFIGPGRGAFRRTSNRRDYAVPPPGPTILDVATSRGRHVISVGKIGDIFAHRGTGEIHNASGNMQMFDRTLDAVSGLADGGLAIVNFLDFDSEYGHRRDIPGYAKSLEDFDARLPELTSRLLPGDLMIVTADHGCDPTWPGTDHTREQVPLLAWQPGCEPRNIGKRETYADIAAGVAQHLELPSVGPGRSFLTPA